MKSSLDFDNKTGLLVLLSSSVYIYAIKKLGDINNQNKPKSQISIHYPPPHELVDLDSCF